MYNRLILTNEEGTPIPLSVLFFDEQAVRTQVQTCKSLVEFVRIVEAFSAVRWFAISDDTLYTRMRAVARYGSNLWLSAYKDVPKKRTINSAETKLIIKEMLQSYDNTPDNGDIDIARAKALMLYTLLTELLER